MEVLKDLYNRYFGRNEGIELIAARLRNGTPYVKAYDAKDSTLFYFSGSGRYIRGTGLLREYDINYQCIYPTGNWHGRANESEPLSSSIYLRTYLEDLDSTYIRALRDQEGENDPEEVIAWLKTIAARLKPYQCYKTANLSITNEIFSGDNIRLYSGKNEVLIPRQFIGNRRLFCESLIGTAFNADKVDVFDEAKIDRKHRRDKDLKRWFVTEKVELSTDRHAIRLTHRNTAHSKIHYFTMAIIADSKAMAGRPFYVKELLAKAVNEIGKTYSATDYDLEIFPSNIDFTWDNKTVSIDVYRDTQSKYPASVDNQPLLIYPPLKVRTSVNVYGGRHDWGICEIEAEKSTDEKGNKGTKGSR